MDKTKTPDLNKYTLLVVDDDENLRKSIAFDFKRRGFNVLMAENGLLAFELVKSSKVNLVISDIRMPGGDGISLLEKIKAYDPALPQVIFVSGFAEVTEAACLEKGARKVFSKPFNRKELMASVFQALGLPPV